MSDKSTKAFPLHIQDQTMQCEPHIEMGMDLRDYFAAKALQGLLASPDCVASTDKLVSSCYQLADAMMKARGG